MLEKGRTGWSPPHHDDEFPTGYSSAGCSPAEPTSASPAGDHLEVFGSALSIAGRIRRCYPGTSSTKGVRGEGHRVVRCLVGAASTVGDPGSALGAGCRP